jgi:hypothetical protein
MPPLKPWANSSAVGRDQALSAEGEAGLFFLTRFAFGWGREPQPTRQAGRSVGKRRMSLPIHVNAYSGFAHKVDLRLLR